MSHLSLVVAGRRRSVAPSPAKSVTKTALHYDKDSYYSILEDIIRRQRSPHPPVVDPSRDGAVHGCKVTVRYGFPSDKPYPSKRDAEDAAAKAAIDALDGAGRVPDGKKFRSYLNELYQKKPDIGQPEYNTFPDKVGPYESVVYLNVVGEATNCESEVHARDAAARKILDKLHLVPSMSRVLSDSRFTDIEFEVKEEAGKYQAAMRASFLFEPDAQHPGYDKPKTAKKYAAQQVLGRLYPEVNASNIDNCVNLLQEKNPSKFPSYDDVRVDDKYKCRVKVNFRTSDTCFHEHVCEAKDAVARRTLVRLGIGE